MTSPQSDSSNEQEAELPQISSTDAFAAALEEALARSKNSEESESTAFGSQNRTVNSVDL